MSHRQKSFFDQDHSVKARSNWQSRSFQNKPAVSELSSSKPIPPRSPIKASSQTKSKLKAFQFTEGQSQPAVEEADKENRQHGADGTRSPQRVSTKVAAIDIPEATTVKTPAKPCPPSTPAMRLPLADLIGNAEDAARRQPVKEQSPEEHIGWIPNSSNSALSPQRRRKRAVSSSPLESSQNEASAHFASAHGTEMHNLQQSLKTPHADPAADLWSRYATGRNPDETPIGLKLPSFAHLMNESSPRPLPKTPGGSVGGLRRWASCGVEWPTSRPKRRRTQGVFRDQQDDVFTDEQGESNGLSNKPSRVEMLLDKVEESLSKPASKLRIDGPSSSSPLPDKRGLERAMHVSPLQQRQTINAGKHDQQSQQEAHEAAERNQRSFSDDFDDGGIDLETFDVNEALSQATTHDHQGRDRAVAAAQANDDAVLNYSQPQLDAIAEDSDEFGDDIDMTVEDLENVVSLFDNRPNIPQQTGILVADAGHEQPIAQEPSPPKRLADSAQAVDLADAFADLSEDEFGDSDIDEEQLAAAEMAATQAYQANTATQGPSKSKKTRAIQRYLVKQVIESQYSDDRGRLLDEKVLLVDEETTKLSKVITLRQSWVDTHCTPGTYVHVVGQFSRTGQITIDDAENMIVVHPDHLIPATVVADSFECIRRAVLQDRVKATGQTSKPMVYGTILHEIFQEAMKVDRWDVEWLDTVIQTTVKKHIESLFELGMLDTNEATEYLRSKMPELRAWAKAFVKVRPGNDAVADDRNGKKVKLSITKLLDVEEHVWSPTYGLKGNIDATVEVLMQDEQGERHLTVPFEVKTGRNTSNASHRAQTALYTLLLSDRYDIEVIYGILYYLETSNIARVPAIRNELRHMVMQRNELAGYVRERLQLPPMLQNPHKCGRCYAKTTCFLYHKLGEDGTTESAGVKEKFDEVVRSLKPPHQQFFKKWDDLLTKEESELLKFRRELWTMLSHEREKLGRCFAEVVIEPGSAHEQEDAQKINRFTYTLIKNSSAPGFSFTESQITVGEPIVISSEQGHFALANGYVVKVSSRRITVAVDRRLHNARKRQPGFDPLTNQSFAAMMDVSKKGTGPMEGTLDTDDVVYRLDKDEFSNGMATVRNNLLAIMDDNVYRSHELRSLIVDNTAPAFKPTPTAYALSGPASQLQINQDQRLAIDKVMSAKDYALVLGMPGTGKTTTIAHIIRALVANGKSVLLTSYTHTAVDNILLKLRASDISILRLGALAKIHPEVQEFANLAAVAKQSIEELEDTYMKPQVVATTCLGVNHQLFNRRVFDYCIVDEASQITLPVCLGPIRMARTFVLVGDHYQLPPLVQNREAQEGGLDVSLFKLLSDRNPESVVNLEHQYRMCEEIMLLSNTLIYSGRLKCGNDAVAQRSMHVPNPDGLRCFHNTSPSTSYADSVALCQGNTPARCWLNNLLAPARKVVFANTDTIAPIPRESASGSRIVNDTEVALTAQLVLGLLAQGVPASDIGVITFYRSQLALLRGAMKRAGADAASVEMHTADKFQGRDKEVVVLSCVRSNEQGNVGDLLKDWRRVNVAFTRARSKLVVLGSRDTLAKNDLLAQFMGLVDEKGWRVDLPANAVAAHAFEDSCGSATQVTQRSPEVLRTRKVEALGETKTGGNRLSPKGAGLKVPGKVGKVGQRAILTKSKPVLVDIVNDVLGSIG